MKPAFADPVFGAQEAFRALMEAMARPGRVQRCDVLPDLPEALAPSAAAALLALADAETPVWTDATGEAREWIAFHSGAPLVEDIAGAQFLLVTGALPKLATLALGSDEVPQDSATVIAQIATLGDDKGWRLTGPGIEHEHRLDAAGLPADFLAQWAANRRQFPRGVDVVLCAGARLAALPRTVKIEEAG